MHFVTETNLRQGLRHKRKYGRWVLWLVWLAALAGVQGCSVTKYVADGEYLLDETEIKTHAPGISGTELQNYLAQQPNFKVFGMARLRLATYSLSGRDTSKRRNRWLRRMGEPPVIYDPLKTKRSDLKLQQYFKTKGYLDATVSDTVVLGRKRAKVIYRVTENTPYRLRNIAFDFHNDTTLGGIISRNRFSATRLEKDMLFDMDVLGEERNRIADIARRNGYYYFQKDDVSFLADSSLRSHQVDLTLVLNPYHIKLPTGEEQEVMHPQYTVRSVNVVELPTSTARLGDLSQYDTLSLATSQTLYYSGKRPFIRKKIVNNNLQMFPGMWYNDFFVNRTYSRMSALGIVRSADISFSDAHTDNNELDAYVVLTPNKPHSFSLDLEGTNSSGDLGFAVTSTLQHRNLFRGSENLALKGRYALESVSKANLALSDVLNDRVQEFYGELSLKFPRFVFPFLNPVFKRRIASTTEFSISFDDQKRPEYTRYISTASMRYDWNMRRFYSYTIRPFDLNYVYLPWISHRFEERYSDPKYSVLRYSYSDHLIFASGVQMGYNNQQSARTLNKTSYKVSLESAGNLLYGISKLTNAEKENGMYEVANIPYSQYVKGEFEYAYNRFINKSNRVVLHGKLGLEYPYGNAEMVPFEKRFFGGGANGVRGWSVRTLGPGSYSSPSSYDFVSQSGNIELTLNAEYRSKLFWLIEGAAFVDAGNIWNIKDYEFQPDGTFRFDRFYKQIALAYGLGLRFDFTYFIIRLDLGMKAFDPELDGRQKWRYRNITWHDDFAFHFAIGYPF